MSNKKEIHKFIDSSNLPRMYKGIDWKNTVGYNIYFEYDDIKDFLKIVDVYNKNNRNVLLIEYKNKHMEIIPSHLLECKIGKLLNKNTSNFKIEIGTTFKDDKRDIIIIDRKYIKSKNGQMRKYYKYKCNKCGFDGGEHWSIKDKKYKDELWIEESNLLGGNGCASCCPNSQIIVKGINDIATTHPYLIKYFVNIEDVYKHSYSSNKKVWLKCPNCKIEKYMDINTFIRQGFSCLRCSDGISYPNKFMFNLLNQLGIKFETEKRFDWCKYKINKKETFGIYDFYIPYMNLIIEMDGGLGHGNNIYSKSNKTREETIQSDIHKDRLANEYNIQVVRIDCNYYTSNRFEYIKDNILNSEINKVFDLSIINWNKCEEYSCSNLVKIACKYKKNNPNLTTAQIGKMMGYSSDSIRRWLIQGTKFNWCNYSGVEEKHKLCKKMRINNFKPIEIFKNNISLGLFNSIKNLEEYSEELFGVKLIHSGISHSYKNNKPYKGFTFKYITLEEYERRISEDPTLKESEQAL